MADLASTAVTVNSSWTEGGTNGRRNIAKNVSLVLTGQGSVANKILATALGYTKILRCTQFVKSDSTVMYLAAPSHDGTYIVLTSLIQATDASRATPADVTGVTIVGTVVGY